MFLDGLQFVTHSLLQVMIHDSDGVTEKLSTQKPMMLEATIMKEYLQLQLQVN